jgi:phosphatidylglycerophosphatase C
MLPLPVSSLIERIVLEHAGQPVVFDADGTLWRGDVGEDFLRYAIHRGLFEASYERYEALLSESPARAYAYCVEVMADHPEAELEQACAAFFAERFSGRIFGFVRPLLARLKQAGCPLWICSASPRWIVVPGAIALGIPASQVIGVTCAVKDGRLTGAVEQPVPVGPGKVAWLKRFELTPALGVGNGDFDVDMLEFSKHGLVISPPDSRNGLVLGAHARGWPILNA